MANRIATWGVLFLVGGIAVGCGRVGFEENAAEATLGDANDDTSEATSADANDDTTEATLGDAADVSPDSSIRDGSPDASFDAGPLEDALEGGANEAGCSADACAVCTSDAECRCASFGGHVYRFCVVARAWADARSQCETAGMRLARVDDGAENAWIRATADGQGIAYAWLGMSDPTHASVWEWTDGAIFWMGDESGGPVGGLYENWNAAHPTGATVRACGGLLSGQYAGEWDDRSCTSLLAYVCEAY